MVVVTVSHMGGEVLLGPENFDDSTSVAELKTRIDAQRAEPSCFVRLLADCQTPHASVTLQKLRGNEETLQLTAIFEYKLTSKERQDYIKQLANHDEQAREIFKQMPLVARSDDAVIMAAIRRDWQAMEFAAGGCPKDKDFMLLAVRANRRALQFASQELKADQELVHAAATLNGYALQYADPSLRENTEFMMKVCRRNGAALEFAHQSIKANKEVVTAAVRDDGMALCFADAACRADPDIVKVAVAQRPSAKVYAINTGLGALNSDAGAPASVWRR